MNRMTDSMPNRSTSGHETFRRRIGVWLLVCCAMVFMMVVLGGLTRLTKSGLSMVEWHPLTVLPPLTDADWRDAFTKYQLYPEYHEKNFGMTLSEFKGIFWLEFVHRNWGRLIGVVFFVPLAWFLVRGWVDRRIGLRLAGIFSLGGLQGAMGWFMVKSGLADRPDVSQYRLTAHLGLAVIIFAAMLWTALDLVASGRSKEETPGVGVAGRALVKWVAALVILAFITMMSGGFVAGLGAGKAYNTFPLMDGHAIPNGLFAMQPTLINIFENAVTVQFDHRLLAETLVTLILLLWFTTRSVVLAPRARLMMNAFAGMALIQASLGISTLLLVVPVSLASLHQAGAIAVFTLGLWLAHELRGKETA